MYLFENNACSLLCVKPLILYGPWPIPPSAFQYQKTDILRAPTWNNCAKSKRFLHAVHAVAVSRELNLLTEVDQLSLCSNEQSNVRHFLCFSMQYSVSRLNNAIFRAAIAGYMISASNQSFIPKAYML